jgi:cell fate regulator YaaT (PSP1 superfamily)
LGLTGVKIVSAEYSFDGKRLSIFYNYEGEAGNLIKKLKRDLHKKYSSSKLEIRPLGPRDVAKSICGIGACGKEVRCCCSFLTEFSSISIRMAKNQGISLTPVEITGMCGRLRCCLSYENEEYAKAVKGLPKKNKRIKTPLGEGRVVEVRALSEEVVVDIREIGKKVFTKEELNQGKQ